jgi:primary-amine oxidase
MRSTLHPLDPLTPEEIAAAVSIVRKDEGLGGKPVRFASLTLKEPAKDVVLGFKSGDVIRRRAFIVLIDGAAAKTYEAIVSLNEGVIESMTYIPDVQPSIMLSEFVDCEATVKASPLFHEALAKRGITDIDLVMVDPWSAGNHGIEDEKGIRLAQHCAAFAPAPSTMDMQGQLKVWFLLWTSTRWR